MDFVVQNLIFDPSSSEYEAFKVGSIYFGDTAAGGNVELNEQPEEHVLTWPDGTMYPQVPWDGSPPDSSEGWLIWILAVVGVLLLATAIFATSMLIRTKKLHKRIKAMEEGSTMLQDLDMESPLAKMLEFLKQYSSSHSVGPYVKGPPQTDAKLLLSLIVSNSENLAAPNIMEQIRADPEGVSDMARYLAKNYGHGAGRDSGNCVRRESSVSIGLDNWQPESGSTGEEYGDQKQMIQETEDAREHGIATWLYSSPGGMVVPSEVEHAISNDYFLDFISYNSPMAACSSPLAAVAKQAVEMLQVQHLMTGGNLERLLRFALRVEAGYPSGYYHSKLHAADVTNRLVSMLKRVDMMDGNYNSYTSIKMCASLVAAMLHDYEHPQVTNQFLVHQGAAMAEEFNDQSVAEHHAIKQGLELLKRPGMNFTNNWKQADKREFRSTVVQIILATDMSRHFDIVTLFNTKVAENDQLMRMKGANKWAAMDAAQQMVTLQMAMKVADLGHCALPLAQHKQWVPLLQEEMFRQGDKEKSVEAPVSFLMDRNKPGPCSGKNQVGFFKMIVIPLFTSWCKAFPECNSLLEQAEANLRHWENVASSQS